MKNNEKNDDKVQFVFRLYNSEVQRNIFQVVIQRLTFTPSISIYEMARIALQLNLGKEAFKHKFFDDDGDFNAVLAEEIMKPYRRICQELKNFAINTKEVNTNKSAIACVKIYDKELQARQFNVYNNIAKKVGFSVAGVKGAEIFEKAPSFDAIWSALDLEGTACKRKIMSRKGCRDCKEFHKCTKKEVALDSSALEILSKYVPHYYLGDRDGVSFIEYIMIQGIYIAKWKQDYEHVMATCAYSVDAKVTDRELQTILAIIDSADMYKTYVDVFFMVFYDILLYKYEDVASEYIRQVRLPERYRKTRNAFEALDKHEECQLQSIIDGGSWYAQYRAINLASATADMAYLAEKVLPNVWKTMINESDKRKEKKRGVKIAYEEADSYEKSLVSHYYRMIKTYIDTSIQNAKEIIKNISKK